MVNQIIPGDIRDVARTLASNSVHMIVTSPPYWGLRDYGGWKMMLLWGTWDDFTLPRKGNKRKYWQFRLKWRAAQRGIILSPNKKSYVCGLGLEPTPEMHIKHMIIIFRELRRVLRPDGTLWLNYGDCYASSINGRSAAANKAAGDDRTFRDKPFGTVIGDLKSKDLVGMAWEIALALRRDGWWLRADIIWHKPNPMPESVRDRPTKSHEYLFLLAKSERYFYDAEAIREAHSREWWFETIGPDYMKKSDGRNDGGKRKGNGIPTGRNKRSVWTIATHPYTEAHFATFPPKLVEPCILAGTSARGVCPACGAPWERVININYCNDTTTDGRPAIGNHRHNENLVRKFTSGERTRRLSSTTGWQPTCTCAAGDPVPATVLDPFFGSGTVGAVCIQHKRNFIGVELNPDYIELAKRRLAATQPALFAME